MDCVITIKGYGSGKRAKQGKTAKDKTGPVRDFIKDLESYYRGVYQHCVECDKCDKNEILRGFLTNRIVRHKGIASDLITKYALKYAKFPGVDQDLVNEFLWRCQLPSTLLLNHAHRLTTRQILQHVELNRQNRTYGGIRKINLHSYQLEKVNPARDEAIRIINAAVQIYEAGGQIPTTIDQLEELVSVAFILST